MLIIIFEVFIDLLKQNWVKNGSLRNDLAILGLIKTIKKFWLNWYNRKLLGLVEITRDFVGLNTF